MGVRDIVDWPEPYTISETVRNLKRKFTESFTDEGEDEKERDLNYIVAVSSGKAVSEEIPSQIGRRAGWASQQGANFVELLIENPAQLTMDSDILLNLADQLDLHYNVHSSTSMAYGMSYRRGRGNGYDSAHEYTVKLLKAIRRFRGQLQDRGMSRDSNGYPRLYAVNGHMAVAQFPSEEERLAQDVSVDPFGIEIDESEELFDPVEARLGIFKHFIWKHQGVGDDYQEFASVLNAMEGTNDPQEYIQANLIELLEERNYINNGLLELVNRVQQSQQSDRIMQQLFNLSRIQDVPSNIDSLKSHTNAQQIGQSLATADPVGTLQEQPQEQIQAILEQMGLDSIEDVPHTDILNLAGQEWERLQENARQAITDEDGAAYNDVIQFLRGEKEGDPADSMRNLASSRRLYQDDFNKESSIFRRIMPVWMPFANQPQVREMWENITDQEFSDHEEAIDWLYRETEAMDQPRLEEDVIAAATGAYVWGHFTQVPPGYEQERDKSLLKLLEEADVYWSFESHMAGPAENARIWKPKDMIEVVKAINATPVEVQNDNGKWMEEPIPRTRITIDMEHIASQKIDPMWVIDPDEEGEREGYKGLEDGDGEYIMINHVTHPYITEEGHQHGPIRRGDTRVYEYIHKLVEKGMTKDEKPTIVMYEIGNEKDETLYMLRLILNMIEHGIEPEQLKEESAAEIINKEEPEDLEEYLIQKFFGVTDTEVQHEWQEIHQHALDPLEDLLDTAQGGHTWMGRAATEGGTRPEEWEAEEYK